MTPFGPSTHACFAFSERGELEAGTADAAARDLREGRRVLWVTGQVTADRAKALLRERRLDVDRLVGDRLLLLRSPEDCFFRDGRFDRFRALAFVQEEADRARKEGLEGLTILQEPAVLARRRGGNPWDLAAYEAGLNVILRRSPVRILCAYDRRRTPPELLLRSLDLHPVEMRPKRGDLDNPFYQVWTDLSGRGMEEAVEERLRFLDELRDLRETSGEPDRHLSPLLEALREARARAGSERDLFKGFLRAVGRKLGSAAGHVLKVATDPETGKESLVSTGVWHLAEAREGDRLVGSREEARLDRGEGVAGTAWRDGRAVWVAEGEASADSREQERGPAAVVAVPLEVGGRIRVVLEFFAPSVEAEPKLLQALEAAAWVAGRIVEGTEGHLASPTGTDVPASAALEEIREEARILDAALQRSRDAVVVTTGSFTGGGPSILYVNPAFTELTGYEEGEALGRSLGILQGPDTDQDKLLELRRNLREGRSGSVEVVGYRKDGSEFYMSWEVFPVKGSGGEIRNFVSIHRDVTSRRMTEEALRQADRDPLTGLLNRKVFLKRLGRVLERSEKRQDFPFAVLFVDLDGFKEVNDRLGHVVGDQLLMEVARRLERTVRPGDTIARYGGDEFVILLEMVEDPRDPTQVAGRIEDQLRVPFKIGGEEVRSGVSIGIALSQSGYRDPEAVIRDADAAMYVSKRRGGGHHVHDEKLMAEAIASDRIQDELREALERADFRLHYQPFVDLGSGRIVGVEALLRWVHPERGLVHPGGFLSFAEASGLIVPIGRWVLRKACEQLRQWQDQLPESMPRPILSVNLSVPEVTAPGLVDELRRIIEETGADPASFQLELPESVFVDRPTETLEIVRSLVELGAKVCIDDFGRSHSSLAYLHRFPVGLLKMDRLFLGAPVTEGKKGNGDGERREGTVRSILVLARNLGMEVIAEGVETPDQRDMLRRLACPYAQGFLFSDPVDAGQAEKLLRAGTPAGKGRQAP